MDTKKKISSDAERKIIDDFAKEIYDRKREGAKPENHVIDFRDEKKIGKTRPIWIVPIELLRFRKDNGRISSDILSYEKINGFFDEKSENTQEIIRKFLNEKDEVKNKQLKSLIKHSGQNEPAIITCDGFLVNGNRRKMILEELDIKTMKVVILPGKGDDGGPPTIKEIEQIENRYQLQSDGKSEYTNFDRAISIKRKIKAGISLIEQLLDDPNNVGLTEKEFKAVIKKYQEEFLGPLECIDRYLEQLERVGLYDNISEGRTDREGRWYAFIDYYKVYKQLRDDKRRNELEVEEDEVGDIEDVAFKIIRQKDFSDYKTHEVIRKIPKILKKGGEAKRELLTISNVTNKLKGSYNDIEKPKDIDRHWAKENSSVVVGKAMKAIKMIDFEEEIEEPLHLLNEALKKLNHKNMDPGTLNIQKSKEAWEISKKIQERAKELEKEFWKRFCIKELKEKKW